MRLRLGMLVPVSARCSLKRRMSSTVAAPGERCRNAANRLQLLMWRRAGAELARGHVLDNHALAKRADNIDAHGKLLSRMRLTNTSILATGFPARYRRSRSRSAMLTQTGSPQQAIAQRFRALAHFDVRGAATSCPRSRDERT